MKAKNDNPMQPPKSEAKPAARRARLGPLSAEVPALTKAALGSRGFAEAGLISDWAAIVGADIGRTSRPVSLKFPKNLRQDGVLTIQAGGGASLELQHLKPQILERINAHFGYRAVAELRFQQGAVARPTRQQTVLAPPSAGDREAVMNAVAGVEDAELKATLARLGMAIHGKRQTVKSR